MKSLYDDTNVHCILLYILMYTMTIGWGLLRIAYTDGPNVCQNIHVMSSDIIRRYGIPCRADNSISSVVSVIKYLNMKTGR